MMTTLHCDRLSAKIVTPSSPEVTKAITGSGSFWYYTEIPGPRSSIG